VLVGVLGVTELIGELISSRLDPGEASGCAGLVSGEGDHVTGSHVRVRGLRHACEGASVAHQSPIYLP
jgi:hypothetical protein